MDNIIINRSDLVGNRKTKFALVEQIVRYNSLNRTGKINYNANGFKDGIGLKVVTSKFVDNYLLKALVPDYNTKDGILNSESKSLLSRQNHFSQSYKNSKRLNIQSFRYKINQSGSSSASARKRTSPQSIFQVI